MPEEFLCARCAKYQRTCCQDSEIHVSSADIRRIRPYAADEDFTEYKAPVDPVYDQHLEDPVWHRHVFRADGTRRVLKQRSNGDCFFLGSEGCLLPAEARPVVCRLFPFDYNADGLLSRLAAGCPIELLSPGASLLTELGMSSTGAELLRKQLYREICETECIEAAAIEHPSATPSRTGIAADETMEVKDVS